TDSGGGDYYRWGRRRILDPVVSGDLKRLVEGDLVVVEYLPLMHVVGEVADDPARYGKQRVRHQRSSEHRRQHSVIDRLDRPGERIALPNVLIARPVVECFVAAISVLRRHTLLNRPFAHRPYPRAPRAHRGT